MRQRPTTPFPGTASKQASLLRGAVSGPFAALLAAPLVLCCASSVPPKTAQTASTTAPAPKANALFERLHAIPRPEPVLLALPDWAQAALRQTHDGLSEEERNAVASGEGPTAQLHPLLHWTAAGTNLAVYAAAVESSTLSDDWVGLARVNPSGAGPDQLIDVANELNRRAALYLLRERAADFAPGREPSVEAMRQVTRAADLIDDPAMARLAAEAWANSDDSLEAELTRLRFRAHDLDAGETEAAVQELKQRDDAEDAVARADAILRDVRTALDAKANRMDKSRALQRLDLHDEVLALLDPSAGTGLDVTTERLRARLGGSVCPGVKNPNSVLCRVAFQRASKANDVHQALMDAWATGKGRDTQSVDHFLGLGFVAPLMYQQDQNADPATPETFVSTLTGLEARAKEANALDPHFEALSLLSETLREAISATMKPNGMLRSAIPSETRAELRLRAMKLLEQAPENLWSQAAALSTMAMSIQDDAVGTELDRLGKVNTLDQPASFGALQLWTSLVDRDAARLTTVRDLLVAITRETTPAGEERSRWLLSWAEADTLLHQTDEKYATLAQLCDRLKADNVPLDLRLRAHLNSAGILARTGRTADALAELKAVLDGVPRSAVDSAEAQEFLVAITGYHMALQGLDASQRPSAIQGLEALLTELRQGSAASPSVLLWLGLWRGELEGLAIEQRCGKGAQCQRKANAARGISDDALRGAVGERTGKLLKGGVLPMGGAEIDLRYSDTEGLRPRVRVAVSFPVVSVPSF